MTQLTVKVLGLEELQKRTGWDPMVQPEMDLALDTFKKRILRGGPGLGAKRNTLTPTQKPLQLNVETTRINPRTKGISWQRKNTSITRSMSGRVMKKAIQRMQARWTITTRESW